MLAWKIAPALAAGNTVVLKPAETTPLSALLFCDVLRQAELPPGVVNIVTGDGRTGAALVKHPDVDKIAFTGSTEVGKAIQRELAGTGKQLTLELGGKAANIIFDDAALDQAVEGIVNGIYFNQGHVCCAGSRLLVQESIYEPLIGKLKRRLTTLRVGDPLDKNTDVGAINSKQQLDKMRSSSRRARRKAPRSTSRRAACPRRATGSRRPSSRTSRRATDRAGGDLRACALGAHVPHARRGGREGEQHAVRALAPACGRRRARAASPRARLPRRTRDRRRQHDGRRRIRDPPARRRRAGRGACHVRRSGRVVNLLTGQRDELAPWLAGHMDVNALDLAGADGQVEELEQLAAENVKRVVRGSADDQSPGRSHPSSS